ncbi:hypothetical protein [Sphingomonas sp. Root1294]|nr:hypothetical protein [Sphingomonas sp. Root1294]
MEAFGAAVTYIDIQPRTLLFKIFRTLARGWYEAFLKRHHARALRSVKNIRFDRVVFLQAHQISPGYLDILRSVQPGARFVLYNWDSLSTHNYLAQAPYFDEIFTFDSVDAARHGFRYLPLFASRDMQRLRNDRSRARAIYMIGNIVNPKRYIAVCAFKNYCRAKGIDFDCFVKITPVVYLRLLRAALIPRGFSLRSISEKASHAMAEQSIAVFDFANHQQSGQTMRMMENLCAGKKIVTNNSWVREEPFYSPDRIHVFEDLDFSGVSEFLEVPLLDPDARFPEYHIQTFVRRLLGIGAQ